MIAEVAPHLAAGVGNPVGPMPGFRIQHDLGGLATGRRQYYGFGIDFHFLLCIPVDISDTLGVPVLVRQNVLDVGIRSQFELAGFLCCRNREPGRREERARVTAVGATPTVMASGM